MNIKRAPGGHGWADAILMANASNQDYIEIMLKRAQQVEKTIYVQPDKKIEAYFGSERFILVYEGQIVMNQTYQYIDCCRGKSPDDFAAELRQLVQQMRANA